jgi:hypothetical protein
LSFYSKIDSKKDAIFFFTQFYTKLSFKHSMCLVLSFFFIYYFLIFNI